ncbi:ankyrin repeat domain-containing protein 26-like [Marmota flaviventris]|uniref:ankyrin repeat domain-containing protein 26-like n=1 Tax=Marmota flaviventris TaxID=93162 RepID=UPI003A881E5B
METTVVEVLSEKQKELGPLSSPVIASSKPKLPKAEDARKEGTPVSPVVSQTAPSLKHPTGLRHSRETTDIEMKGARKKDVKTITSGHSITVQDVLIHLCKSAYLSAQPHFNVKAEEAGTTLGGSKKRKPKRISEICTGERFDGFSEDAFENDTHTLDEPHLDVPPEKGQKSLDGKEKKKAKGCFGRLLKMFHIHSSENDDDANQREKHKVKEHIEVSQEKFPKPTTTMKDSFPNEAGGIKAIRTLKPEPSLIVKTEEKKSVLDDPENKQPKVEITRKKYKINQMEVSQILHHSEEDTDNNGDEFIEQRKNRNADHQRYFLKKNEEHDGHTEKTSNEKSKVKKEINAMEDLDEPQPTVIASTAFQVTCPNYKDIWAYVEKPSRSYEDSHSLPKIQNAVDSCQRIIELEKSHCSQCLLHTQEVAKLENKLCGMKEELSEMENANSKLEKREIKWKQELCHLRHDLKGKEKKLRDFDQLFEKMNKQLREKDEEHNKKIELNKEFQLSSGTLKTELKTVRSNSNQVSTRNETEKVPLHEFHMLKDKCDMLSLEMNQMKCQNEEDKKKYLDVSRAECHDLHRRIKLMEETFRKTTLQYNKQINSLKTEITKLNIKLKNKEQNTERQETEAKSYPASQAVAPHPCDESQTSSQREQELLSQTARDGCPDLEDKRNFKISKRNVRRLIQSPKFSKPGIKFRDQEKGLCIQIRHDLRKVTMILNQVQRDLKQNQCQMNEMKHMYQDEQSQNYKELEPIDERLSQMESKIIFLRQEFHDFNNKSDDTEGLPVYTQEQRDTIKLSQDEDENSSHKLQNRHMELMNRNCHLKEKSDKYKKNSERKVVVRQLPQELADNLTEQPMSEASLEHSSSNHLEVEYEAQGLKKKLDQINCKVDNLNIKLEATASKYSHLDEQFELALESLQYTCEKVQNNQKKLEEDVANLKIYVQDNKIKNGQGEPHRWEIEQRTREILEENEKQASPFSETFDRASNENNNVSLMKLMQFRIEKLESQVSEIKNEISDKTPRLSPQHF